MVSTGFPHAEPICFANVPRKTSVPKERHADRAEPSRSRLSLLDFQLNELVRLLNLLALLMQYVRQLFVWRREFSLQRSQP